MNLLSAENITKTFTGRKLFSNASFYLQEGEKVGIVGINGTGKSTLLKMLAGLEEPDVGEITKANHAVIRYLPQMPEFGEEETVLESVLVTAHRKNQADASGEDYQMWNLESKAKSMLTRLGVYNFEEKTKNLSGGERKRLALVAVLLTPCDILLLDEPTNHLDADMAEWLEGYLKGFKGTLIMVTHDRYFLDSVCNRIAEIDKGSIYSYQENYSGYLNLKQERMDMAVAVERKRQSILRKEIAWMQRGARARSTKQKAHIRRYENLRDQSGPQFDKQVELSSVSSRMGKTTVELHHISKSYGEKKLIEDFSYIFLKNDRVGFVGHNGCGKTTLMKIIDGRVKPDAGELVIGQTIKIGYYSQEIEKDASAGVAYMDPSLKVIEYIRNTAEYVRTEDGLVSASAMLERFLFPPEEQYGVIGKLSGGEKRRLNLLRVLMEAPNVLILDEPTNDLDITTLAILEDYLDNYDGIVITVSHDRYFLDRIAKRIFAFEQGNIRQYEGGYTDYLVKRPEDETAVGNAGTETSGKKADQTENADATENAEKKDSRATWKSGRKLKFTWQCKNNGSGQVGDKAMEKEKNSKNIMDYATVTLLDAENAIEIIDQTKLPGTIELIRLKSAQEIWNAIYLLKIRGAPAIGVAAGFGIYLLAKEIETEDYEVFYEAFQKQKEYLNSSRPTAVNLSWALNRMEKVCIANKNKPVAEIKELLHKEALEIQEEDIRVCKSIGEHGLTLVKPGDGILTHCNAGQLATSKYGTATAPIYLGEERGYHFHVFADETRPLLQGARLTSFELHAAGVDVTLICDNMSGTVMKQGMVQAVFVGCDRVAANGDTANKIGTSVVATVAKRYHVPFYVCAPTSTIDLNTATGDDICIEERPAEEVTEMWYQERMAPEGVKVYNPAFDVTDHDLISGIVTEYGIAREPYTESLKEILSKRNA